MPSRALLSAALTCVALLTLGNTQCEFSDLGAAVVSAYQQQNRKLHALMRQVGLLEERVTELGECTCCCEGILEPVCAADGVTYLNRCEADCAGVSVVAAGPCTPRRCGGPEGVPCPTPAFCDLPPGCGDPLAFGHCRERPSVCTDEVAPVCGCDGRTYTNDCERQLAGVSLARRGECGVLPRECTSNGDCARTETCVTAPGRCDEVGRCLPRPVACSRDLAPVCGCDGQTYPNACMARAAGISIAHLGECTPPLCRSDDSCAQGSFCEFEGCGGSDPSQTGVCVPKPETCPEFLKPVCGCDGVTYANDCFRRAAGVSRAHTGPCDEPPPLCRGNSDCRVGSFCAKPQGRCDATGGCRELPGACPLVLIPVCGCDGNTYGNACEAARAATSVAHEGQCEVPPERCGGFAGFPCPAPDQFCALPPGTCDQADLFGTCVAIPEICIEVFNPVCGCDGRTYANPCFALTARVQLAHRGACELRGGTSRDTPPVQ